jgi:NAD(P)-dependent dehydrogenase (short-subunit alcohol dehydrogenase family)
MQEFRGKVAVVTGAASGIVALSENLYQELALIDAKVKVSVLCPGYLRSNAMESERNRPGALRNDAAVELETRRPEATEHEEAIRRAILTRGTMPLDVAEHVVRAIREERFWILPHLEFNDAIRERTEDILAGRNPPVRG